MKPICALLFLVIFTSSCKDTWDYEDKKAFYQACTETAKADWAKTDELAKTYCDCVFEKMNKKYPNEEDALEHLDQLAKDTDLVKCKDEVLKK